MITKEEARELVKGPGKFEGEHPMVPILWEIFLNGLHDDDDGSVIAIGKWRLQEDSNGFVYGWKVEGNDED
jgi:hypothetical protein